MLEFDQMAAIAVESLPDLSMPDLASPGVREFVVRLGLQAELQDAVSLAQRVFHVSGPLPLSLEVDPDTGETWIEVKVAAHGSVEDVMKAHEDYTERRLALPKTCHRQVRLFLHIARD